jgi:hypothetical protein
MPIFSYADLKMVTDSFYGEGYKDGIKAEREQCCKDICTLCREGNIPYRYFIGSWYHKVEAVRPSDRDAACWAQRIRERKYTEEKADHE